jgi:chondroitin AC lyase
MDHGVKPQNASYVYIVVPGIEKAAIDNYSQQPGISILANTPKIQAVQHKGLNLTQIVFYQAGSIKISKDLTITANSPCLLMIKTDGKNIEKLTASDPTRKLSSLQVVANTKLNGGNEHWKSHWNSEKKNSLIQIDLPTEGYAGQSVVLNFSK